MNSRIKPVSSYDRASSNLDELIHCGRSHFFTSSNFSEGIVSRVMLRMSTGLGYDHRTNKLPQLVENTIAIIAIIIAIIAILNDFYDSGLAHALILCMTMYTETKSDALLW
jgi:hypothetical protein